MQKMTGWLVMLLIVGLPVGYCIHLGLNYAKIQREFKESSARIIHPKIDDADVSEIGYIYEMRRDTIIREGRLNLVWFVVIPATNARYSCSYDSGFPDFRTGDSIRLIHNKDEDEAEYGYLVGLHDSKQGKTTLVWTFDTDNADLDVD